MSLFEQDDPKSDPDRSEAKPTDQVEQLNPIESAQVQAAGAVQSVEDKAPPGKMKVDLHCHTEASADCSTPIELIPGQCISKQIKVQAITDHNTIDGAVRLKKIAADTADPAILTIIVGEEVSTQEGEIVGLFLQEAIPANLTPEDTVKAIKEQGGLVLIPHGFDPMKRWRLKTPALQRIADQVDIIETFNARISNLKWNRAAVDWATERGVLMSAGSDAHRLVDIGSAWVEVPFALIRSSEDLRTSLEGGTPIGSWVHPALAYLLKMWDRTKRRLSLRA